MLANAVVEALGSVDGATRAAIDAEGGFWSAFDTVVASSNVVAADVASAPQANELGGAAGAAGMGGGVGGVGGVGGGAGGAPRGAVDEIAGMEG